MRRSSGRGAMVRETSWECLNCWPSNDDDRSVDPQHVSQSRINMAQFRVGSIVGV